MFAGLMILYLFIKGNEAFKSKKQKLSSEEATKDDLDTNAEDTKKEEKLNDNEEIENVKKGG